ncbi:hypothetical protein Pelo_10375 [Pelomyxa schiedti]|nr:hypothetical protein Pelo_10375 [Pelomyxa schiedti]
MDGGARARVIGVVANELLQFTHPADFVSMLEALQVHPLIEAQLLKGLLAVPLVDDYSSARDRDGLAAALAECIRRDWRRAARWVVEARGCLHARPAAGGGRGPPGVTGRGILQRVVYGCAGTAAGGGWGALRCVVELSGLERTDLTWSGNRLLVEAMSKGNIALTAWLNNKYGFSLIDFIGCLETASPIAMEWILEQSWNEPLVDLWVKMVTCAMKGGHPGVEVIRVIEKCPTETASTHILELITAACQCKQRLIVEYLLQSKASINSLWRARFNPAWLGFMCENKWNDLAHGIVRQSELEIDSALVGTEIQQCLYNFCKACDCEMICWWVSRFGSAGISLDIEELLHCSLGNLETLKCVCSSFHIQKEDMELFLSSDCKKHAWPVLRDLFVEKPLAMTRYIMKTFQIPVKFFGITSTNWALHELCRKPDTEFPAKVQWYIHIAHQHGSASAREKLQEWMPEGMGPRLGVIARAVLASQSAPTKCPACELFWEVYNNTWPAKWRT